MILAGVLVLLGIAATIAFNHFRETETLRKLLSRKVAVTLHADTAFSPLHWSGLSVRSDRLVVHGKDPQHITELRAEDLRASCSLSGLWQREWRVETLSARHLQAAFGEAGAKLVSADRTKDPPLEPQIESPSPLHMEIREAHVEQNDVFWGRKADALGFVKGVSTTYFTRGKGLEVHGTGGTFQQSKWPAMAIRELAISYLKPRLKIEHATLVAGKQGSIKMAGLLDFSPDSSLHLVLDFADCAIAPFLPENWREKFKAACNGHTEIDKKLHGETPPQATGDLNFRDGTLTGLGVLDRTAALTHKPEFQRLPIREIRGHFDWRGGRLKVSGFRFEAKALVCAEGDVTIEKEEIASTLKVGVAPDALEPIPGAREKVFTSEHDGYCWTTVRLSGPVSHPREDLKPRLLAAAREKLIGKSILPVLGPGKLVLEAIEHLF